MSDQSPISAELRTQIILAAVNSVGENSDDAAAWQANVKQAVIDITLMVHDKSPMAKVVDNIAGARAFRAIILSVVKEKSSQRGLISMRTKPSQYAKDGVETARTERFDNADGLRMGRALRELIGHHVTIWIYMEQPTNGGNAVRMIAAFRDEGEATQAEIDGTAQAS